MRRKPANGNKERSCFGPRKHQIHVYYNVVLCHPLQFTKLFALNLWSYHSSMIGEALIGKDRSCHSLITVLFAWTNWRKPRKPSVYLESSDSCRKPPEYKPKSTIGHAEVLSLLCLHQSSVTGFQRCAFPFLWVPETNCPCPQLPASHSDCTAVVL
jgi:hypothetical protein